MIYVISVSLLPVGFEEQVAGQLHQLIVLYIQNLQQRALHSVRQSLQLIMSCTQLPHTVAAEQPVAIKHIPDILIKLD